MSIYPLNAWGPCMGKLCTKQPNTPLRCPAGSSPHWVPAQQAACYGGTRECSPQSLLCVSIRHIDLGLAPSPLPRHWIWQLREPMASAAVSEPMRSKRASALVHSVGSRSGSGRYLGGLQEVLHAEAFLSYCMEYSNVKKASDFTTILAAAWSWALKASFLLLMLLDILYIPQISRSPRFGAMAYVG